MQYYIDLNLLDLHLFDSIGNFSTLLSSTEMSLSNKCY